MSKTKPAILLQADHIHKVYAQGDKELTILRQLNLSIHEGELVGLMGPSGSGKSTLLNILGLLDVPTSGTLAIGHEIVDFHRDDYLTHLRQSFIGFVFQFHHLLPEFTALENVMLPLMISGFSFSEAQDQATQELERVKLQHRLHHRQGQLSGGEQQRVALARALVRKPKLLLADEPTGNLDPATAEHIFGLLLDLCQKDRVAVIMATHNPHFIDRMSSVICLGA